MSVISVISGDSRSKGNVQQLSPLFSSHHNPSSQLLRSLRYNMTSPPSKKHPADNNSMQSSSSASPAQQPANGIEQPQRSRNARAQARHRAKRKAYIEQVRSSQALVSCRIALFSTSRVCFVSTCRIVASYRVLPVVVPSTMNRHSQRTPTRCGRAVRVAFLGSLSLIHIAMPAFELMASSPSSYPRSPSLPP